MKKVLAPSPLEKAINYIETHLNTKITLEDLSKNYGIGKEQPGAYFG